MDILVTSLQPRPPLLSPGSYGRRMAVAAERTAAQLAGRPSAVLLAGSLGISARRFGGQAAG